MASAVLLSHLAKVERHPLRSFIIKNMLREIRVMEILPFQNVSSLRASAIRWKTLPSVAFRSINEGYTASVGDVEQVWEALYGFGGDIEIDRVFDKVGDTVTDLRRLHIEMKIEALAATFNDYFINGDHATDAKGFEGLKKRVAGLPSRQSVYFAPSGGAALDPTSSVANGRKYFDALEEMHYKTNKGNVSAFFTNEGLYYGSGRVARNIAANGGNWLDVTKDSFERQIVTFMGAPIIDMGFKKDQTTEIIPTNETAGDAGTDATSVYSVAFNERQGITGMQLGPMEIYDPLNGGERESKPTKLVRIEWWLGLAGFGSYGAVRGQNVESSGNWA